MRNALEHLPQRSRFAVLRLRSLGDCVLTTPALEILKQCRPDLRIGVVVENRFAPVFEGNPCVDEILPPSLRILAAWRPDLCLNLHGGTRSLLLTAASGARLRAGFAHFRGKLAYNVRIPRAQETLGVERKVHTAEHLASAMFFLGAQRIQIPRAQLYAENAAASSPYAVLHPIASAADKTWPAEGFLTVGRFLRENGGLEPVFIAGPGEDLAPFAEFRTIIGAPLAETKTLLKGAALFIGNDSGPAHMAAAFGVPVVVLFGNSDPIVWAPWQVECEVLTGDSVRSIQPDQVIRA
ncbi:MAG: glycosyltransferase family 9 protein, partial [Bryobacteraceae bacterium]